MKQISPMEKIEMIRRSQRCFFYGLFGLLPVIGIPMVILATIENYRIQKGWPGQWNPAKRYSFWGMFCARIGLFMLIGLFTLIVYLAINASL
jgi:hypothetical protein